MNTKAPQTSKLFLVPAAEKILLPIMFKWSKCSCLRGTNIYFQNKMIFRKLGHGFK